MIYKPKYGENIIVGINKENKFEWYLTDRDSWILDIIKYSDDYTKNGYNFNVDEALKYRYNIKIVNEYTVTQYLVNFKNYIVKSYDLTNLILNNGYNDTILSLRPSLYINFDNKQLFSLYPEALPFERYVPDGWIGVYDEFFDFIPDECKYWMINGVDIIQKINDKEIKDFKEE